MMNVSIASRSEYDNGPQTKSGRSDPLLYITWSTTTRLFAGDSLTDIVARPGGFCSSPSPANLAAAGLDVVHQVEAKYPALLFKQQLTAFVEKLYGIIWDKLRIRNCIHCFPCVSRDVSQLSKTFPDVNMVFSDGQKLSLSPENYLFRHTKVCGAYCLGIFPNGKDSTTLLGGIVVRNTLVTYDQESDKIGFWKTNCSELWKGLHIPGAPAPAPVVPFSRNSTIEMSPMPAPSGLPQNVFPVLSVGKFRIGLITFHMSFNMNYSSARPNFTELAEFIAHELEVSASQVHLLNFTSKENVSLVRWAIFPAESADYISNTTAMSIILRLTEHHMQLPGSFGSYQLVEWNVHPQMKKTMPLIRKGICCLSNIKVGILH
ncbi:hypothetical protein L1049_002367 [Liquidambar formosana]|uniref:Peptidase A1 domain-containing protein n=1 Tax=Liquidambar formosana TaxID=63359 RepID=A0AAP0NFI7_LIQFO